MASIPDFPKFGIEICYKINENYPEILADFWGRDLISDFYSWFLSAQEIAIKKGIDYISLMFNIEDEEEISGLSQIVEKITTEAKISLIIKGSGNKKIDKILLPELVKGAKRPVIFAPIQDENYKEIISAIISSDIKGHKVILRTPIDINLTKELNILSIDAGIKKEDIIVDPDTGCIGYGIDYGYSIIERMIEAKNNGDDMLDVPIVVFSGLESYKAKEAKSKNLGVVWGDNEVRSFAWEIATTSALICAGVDIAILWHPEIVDELKRSFQGLC